MLMTTIKAVNNQFVRKWIVTFALKDYSFFIVVFFKLPEGSDISISIVICNLELYVIFLFFLSNMFFVNWICFIDILFES